MLYENFIPFEGQIMLHIVCVNHILFIHSFVDVHWVVSTFWLLWITLQWTLVYKYLFSVRLGVSLGAELLALTIILYLTLCEQRIRLCAFDPLLDISEIGRSAKSYCEHTARTQPTLSDIVVTLVEMGEYTSSFPVVQCSWVGVMRERRVPKS